MERYLAVILIAADQLRRGQALADVDMRTLRDAIGAIEKIRDEARVIA